MTKSYRRPAFTLIELIVVLAIVGILAATAIPRFSSADVMQRADAAARRIVDDVNYARRYAYQTGVEFTIGFNVAADTYQLTGIPDPDRPGQTYVVSLGEYPYEARLVSANFSGNLKVAFDAYGIPDNGGVVVVGVGDELRDIFVDPDTGEAYLP